MLELTEEEKIGVLKVADYLAECTKCGHAHTWTWKNPDEHKHGGTWASPEDGHAYARRSQAADLLRDLVEGRV